MRTPQFPPPDPRDPPDVADSLRNAAALWQAGRYNEALPYLMRAAAVAQHKSDAPRSDPRVVELAMTATDIAAFVHSGEDPKSIPISLDFGEVDIESLPSAAIEFIGPPRPPPARQALTMRQDVRPSPDTQITPPPTPNETSTLDLTQTLPQGTKLPGGPVVWPLAKPREPAPTLEDDPHGAPTRRMDDIETKRDPRRR